MNPTPRTQLVSMLAELDQAIVETQELLNECPRDHEVYFQATCKLHEMEEARREAERVLRLTHNH